MALRMARPFRHPKTGIFWFRKAVPAALRERVGKREISQSLATRDPDTAKELAAPLDAEWNARFKSLQTGVTVLTQKQIVALAGRVYKAWMADMSDEPGPATIWERLGALAEARAKAGKPLNWFTPELDAELLREGLTVDEGTRARLIAEADKAFLQSTRQLKRNAQGDYRPDPEEARFPEWVPSSAPEPATAAPSATPIMGLFEGYLRELRASGKGNETERRWTPVLRAFTAFLEHDDASRVTKEDVIRWKDERLTPDAGSVKTGQYRDVLLGDLEAVQGERGVGLHLVADGFHDILRHQKTAMNGVSGGPDGLPLEAHCGEDGGRRGEHRGGIGHDAEDSIFVSAMLARAVNAAINHRGVFWGRVECRFLRPC